MAGVGGANNVGNVGNANNVFGVAGSNTFIILRVAKSLPMLIEEVRQNTSLMECLRVGSPKVGSEKQVYEKIW